MKKISILIGLLLYALTTANDCGDNDEQHITFGYPPELIITHSNVMYRGGRLQVKRFYQHELGTSFEIGWYCYPHQTDGYPSEDGWHRLALDFKGQKRVRMVLYRLIPF